MFTIFAVLFQKAFEFGGEVNIAVTGAGFRLLNDDFFACELDDIAADMNGTLIVVDVAPFQTTALAAPHPRCNEQFEICFIFDAFIGQPDEDGITFQELAVRLNYNDPSGAEKAYKNALRKLKANLYSGAYGQWLAIRKAIDRAKAEADSGNYATPQTTWTDEKK